MYASYSLLQFISDEVKKIAIIPMASIKICHMDNRSANKTHHEKIPIRILTIMKRNSSPTVKIIDLVEIIELLASDDDDDLADQWSGAPFRLVRREINCF